MKNYIKRLKGINLFFKDICENFHLFFTGNCHVSIICYLGTSIVI